MKFYYSSYYEQTLCKIVQDSQNPQTNRFFKGQKAYLQWSFHLTSSITRARWTTLTPTPQSNIYLQNCSFVLRHMEMLLHQLPENMLRQGVGSNNRMGRPTPGQTSKDPATDLNSHHQGLWSCDSLNSLKIVSWAGLFTVHFTILFITYMTQSNGKLKRRELKATSTVLFKVRLSEKGTCIYNFFFPYLVLFCR